MEDIERVAKTFEYLTLAHKLIQKVSARTAEQIADIIRELEEKTK